MPIERYRNIEEVPAPERRDPSDPRFLEQLFAFLSSPPRRLSPLFRPGVYKYRSMDEANEAREAALIERAQAARHGEGA